MVNFTNLTSLEKIRVRLAKTLSEGIQLNLSTETSKELLRSHLNTKINVVTMFVDISRSTEMSLSLPERKFALLIQGFAQEVSIAAIDYGGYIFKYEGDAVIVIFPAEHDKVKVCKNALNCSKAVLEVIKVSNTAFSAHELPEISVKIGMTYGHGLVVLYGNDSEKAYIDMIGSSISLASKIVSIADPNQILVGENFYRIVHSSKSINCSNFAEVSLNPTKWKYLSHFDPHSRFRVYEYY